LTKCSRRLVQFWHIFQISLVVLIINCIPSRVITYTIDYRLYQMSHSAKIVSAIFYEHALAAILAVSVIHAMKREQWRHLLSHWPRNLLDVNERTNILFYFVVFELKNLSKKCLKRTKRFQNKTYLFQFAFLTLLDS
jgi:hypothetical protein